MQQDTGRISTQIKRKEPKDAQRYAKEFIGRLQLCESPPSLNFAQN